MLTIALVNQKGGVAKTATTLNLAVGLARHGFKVLAVDLDSQANLTKNLGVQADGNSFAEVIKSEIDDNAAAIPLASIVQPVRENLSIVPSSRALASRELELVVVASREMYLKWLLEDVAADFDVAVIDCPPDLGVMTLNGLAAADGVIVPTQSEKNSVEGVAEIIKTFNGVKTGRGRLNPDIEFIGVLVTMYSSQSGHQRDHLELIQSLNLPLFETIITRSTVVSDANGANEAVIEFSPKHKLAGQFEAFTKEVITWLRKE